MPGAFGSACYPGEMDVCSLLICADVFFVCYDVESVLGGVVAGYGAKECLGS